MLVGASPEESSRNLYDWLDAVASEFLQPSVVFVYAGRGNRQPGFYHQMKSGELEKFIGEVSTRLQDWEAQCKANQKVVDQ